MAQVVSGPSSTVKNILDRSHSETIHPDRTPSPSALDEIIQAQYTLPVQKDLPTADSTPLDGYSVNITSTNADDIAIDDAIT